MIQHALGCKRSLLKAFPKGFALDETPPPAHLTPAAVRRMADLDKVYAAADKVFAREKPTSWKLKAFKYYYIPSPPVGLGGNVVQPTPDLHKLQEKLIHAIAPFTTKGGSSAAFVTDDGGRDIQPFLIEYVANFVRSRRARNSIRTSQSCRHRNYLNEMLAEPSRHSPSRGWCVGLPTWQLWNGSKGTQGFYVEALRRRFGKRSNLANRVDLTTMARCSSLRSI